MKLAVRYLPLVICILLFAANSFAEAPMQPPKKAAAADQKVSFNFVDVDLSAITKFISEITKKNFIFDERVKGKITIITPSKLSIDDAYDLFVSVLELKGYTVVPSGVDAYKIIPSAEAKQKGVLIAKEGQPVNDTYIARLIKLNNISSDDALRLIQPVVSRDGYISAFGPGNTLLVIDSGLNVEKVLSIVEIIDKPYSTEEPDIFILKHSSAEAVARILNEGMSRRHRPAPQPQALEEIRAVADTRLNAVIIFGDKGAREAMKSLIRLLDVPSPEAQGRVNVYFLENADAAELSKVLEGMLKSAAAPARQPGMPGAQLPQTGPFDAGGINITADKATNSLVVVSSPADYQNLAQIIKQLDRRRKQVFVEAMIAEVSIDKLLDLGTKFRGAATEGGKPIFIGGVGNVSTSTIQSIISGLTGLTLGGVGNYLTIPQDFVPGAKSDVKVPGLAALFSLSEFKDAVNVLSTPQILTSDNKEAEIVVGENVPFISKRERDITTTNTVLSSIERKDVGITLKITPQIAEGDYVKLDIYQEISSLKQDSENILINVGPTTTKRSTKTSVVVKDRQTVVISGLMEERSEETMTKVPLLGDIPLLGWLFKFKSESKKKMNLLVFITPHMVKEGDSLAKITQDKKRSFLSGSLAGFGSGDGQIMVKFKEDVPAEKAVSLIMQKDAYVTGFIEDAKAYKVKPKEGMTVEDALKDFSGMPEVQSAERL